MKTTIRTRTNILAACVVVATAGLSSSAEAVMLNPNGLGQVLLFPYYTTQGGNDTLISIVNTSPLGKAIKLRFMEARNGRPVLDFHLYLGSKDVWTAALGHAGDLGSGLTTVDRSCTVPDIARGGLGLAGSSIHLLPDGRYFVPFTNTAYTGVAQDHSDAAAATLGSLERTREGHIEVIEMADIMFGTLSGWVQGDATGEPGNCLEVNRAWLLSGGAFVANPNAGLQAPNGSGALYGNAMIVNPARGTVLGYAADALIGFNHRILHRQPGAEEPGLHSANDPGEGGDGQATAQVAHSRGMVEVTYRDDADGIQYGKIDAISALYATTRLFNDFYLDQSPQVTGASEWVVSFPTRRYYVDSRPSLPAGEPFVTPAGSFRAPFTAAFSDFGMPQLVGGTVYDRHQRSVIFPPGGFIPRPGVHCVERALCWQTQVIAFSQRANFVNGLPSDILGSNDFFNLVPPSGFEAGWMDFRFIGEPSMRASEEGVVFHGVPATGFFATNYDNEAAASGVLANYSALFRHRAEPSCSGAEICQ